MAFNYISSRIVLECLSVKKIKKKNFQDLIKLIIIIYLFKCNFYRLLINYLSYHQSAARQNKINLSKKTILINLYLITARLVEAVHAVYTFVI